VNARDEMTALKSADLAARQRALAADESFIVQAPAGSGKTELLIQRSLSLLARAEHPSEVLAITFTKKAAGEMRSRLVEALVDAHSKAEPTQSPERERWQLARAVLARDASRDWRLLQRPALLNIDTFDAFSLRIVKLAPFANDGANISLATLEEDASSLHREAARRAILEASESDDVDAVSTLLNALDNRVDSIVALLADLLSKRAQWIDRLIDDSDEAIAAMRGLVVASIERQVRELHRHWPHAVTPRTQALAAYAADHLENVGRQARAMRVSSASFDDASIASLADWNALAGLLLTEEGTWRRQFIKTDGFPAASDKGLSSDEKQARTEAKGAITALLEDLQAQPNADALRQSFVAVRGLPDHDAIAAHEPILRAALNVLKLAAAELLLIEKSRAVTDFSGVSIAAKLALLEYRDEVFARLDAGIRHILVDEFQDTNPAQASLIETLVEPWMPNEGHTLFLVGDPMQSIYAFRDADVGIFMDAWNHGVSGWALTPLTLSANYRSSTHIVDWVNATLAPVFARVSTAGDAPKVAFAPAVAVRDDATTNEAPKIRAYASAQEEARAIVADIARVRANAPEDTMAIIVRAKAHANEIIRELQAANIAFTAREMATWSDRPLIRDLLSLAYVLAQPSDRLSWYAWLRSPMIGLSLATFTKLGEWQEVMRRDMPAPLFDIDLHASLDASEKKRIELAKAALHIAHEQSNLGTLASRVHAVFRFCGGDAIASSVEAKEEVEAFLSFLDEQTIDGFLPPRDVFEALVAKQHRSFSSTLVNEVSVMVKPVEVLTIHKAKGLEWHHVYLPQFNRAIPSEKRDLITWNFMRYRPEESGDKQRSWDRIRISHHQPAQLLVGAKESRRRAENSVYQFVHDRRTALREEETKRLLYVAVTRARERLVLTGSDSKRPRKATMASLLDWPLPDDELPREMTEAISPRVVFRQSLTRLRSIPSAVAKETNSTRRGDAKVVQEALSAKTDFADKGIDSEDANRHNDIAIGVVGHKLIEGLANTMRCGRAYSPSAPIVARWLAREGMGDEQAGIVARNLLNVVQSMAKSTHFAFIHDATHIEAADELPLMDSADGEMQNLRVDRTFIAKDGTRWIVDYKFATPPTTDPSTTQFTTWLNATVERYREQLDMYRQTFSRIDPTRDIKTALYLPTVDRLLLVE
jgi:ATP-dependent helicase/nuclease subunit A